MIFSKPPRMRSRTMAALICALAVTEARAQDQAPATAGADVVSAGEPATPEVYPQTIAVPSAPPAVPAPADAPGDPAMLQEVIVTAQKRPEDGRKVPIALTVLSGDDLRNAGITRFDDVARQIPNVSFNSDFNSLYMRGIGTAELNILSEQAISYVLDGVYVSRLDYLKPGFMDVDRIEVLKGPQGTLYGRNATAGVMSITYGEPTQDWMTRASFSLGERNLRKAEGVLSGPITDALSFRVAGSLHREDGHTLNLANGQTLGDKDTRQLRAKLRYDVNEALRLDLSYEQFDYFIGVWGSDETFQYPAALRPAITALDPHFETKLDRRGSANQQNASDGNGRIASLKATLDLWDTTFTSITAYSSLDDLQGGDIDGSAAPLAELSALSKSDALSQEFRVVSAPGTLEYVAGLFLYKSRFDADLDIPLAPDPGLGTVAGAAGIGPLIQILNPLLGSVLDPATALLGAGDYADDLNGLASVDIKALGVFGQLTWHLTDRLALLLGGRYSRDSRHGTVVESDEGPVPLWSVLTLGGYSANRRATDSNFSPKVSLTWDVLRDITLYGTYARGFRAGSYNIAAFSPEDFEFRPEASTTYEAGIKTDLFKHRLRFNFGGFHTIYHDYQLATFNGFSYNIANAEKVRSKGLEADLKAMLFPGVILSTAAGYNLGKFIKYDTAGCPTVFVTDPGGIPPQGIAALPPDLTCDLSGRRLHRAPRWTGHAELNFLLPLFDSGIALTAGGGASYKGFEYMDSDLDPVDSQDGYWLYNAHVGLLGTSGTWRFVVQGANLGNKLVKTFSGDIPLQPGAHGALTNPPRTITAMLQLEF
ncbi:MAG TPA: TonB-dependent receptor [Solimonas sp.]|nr:TonB-dependent receptor [Solimonas sp.]